MVTFTADLGQGEELEPARAKAEMLGIKDLYRGFARRVRARLRLPHVPVRCDLRRHLFLGIHRRPLIAKRQIEIAQETGYQAAHGATGKAMIRCVSSWDITPSTGYQDHRALAGMGPGIAEVADRLRGEESDLIPKDKGGEPPYSQDANLSHISSEGKALEDPWVEPDESVYTKIVLPGRTGRGDRDHYRFRAR